MGYITVWPGLLKMSETNKCMRLAIKPEQGRGWADISGTGWIYPEARVGAVVVYTPEHQPILVVWDSRTGKPYRIASRNGPSGSGIVKRYVDRYNSYGSTEISWEIILKEHRGIKPQNVIKHLQSHVGLRPQEESDKGKSEYNEHGYRTAQKVTLKLYKDGNLAENAVTEDIPYNAEITMDRQIEDNRIQVGISGTASSIKVVSASTLYENKDQRGSPTEISMPKDDWQREFAEPLLWLSRSENPLLNLASGTTGTGSIFASSTGPDGYPDSAMTLSAANAVTWPIAAPITGDFSLVFSISNIIGNIEIFRIGTFIVRVAQVGAAYVMTVQDGLSTYSKQLAWTGTNWVHIKIARSGNALIFSENGNALDMFVMGAVNTYSGNYAFIIGNAKRIFNVWFGETVVSLNAFKYLCDDITNNNGKALLPIV